MIRFVLPAAGTHSIDHYLARDGRDSRTRLEVATYDGIEQVQRIPTVCHVFGGLDRVLPAERALAGLITERLESAAPPARVLNHPRHVLLRHDLLRAAHRAGINQFRAFRASAFASGARKGGDASEPDGTEPRFPVFVREADDHNGALTRLIHDRRSLERELAALALRGVSADLLLVVEFCDTADAGGIYRKYSAFVVGDRIIPRYLNMSRSWMVKHDTRIYDMSYAAEELAYLETNPHESWLRRAFELGRIRYGRIDYAVKDGQPQIWEINTNPTIGPGLKDKERPPEVERYRSHIAPGRARFFRDFAAALESIDTEAGGSFEFEAPADLRVRLAQERSDRQRTATRAVAMRRLTSNPLARAIQRRLGRTALRLAPLLARVLRS